MLVADGSEVILAYHNHRYYRLQPVVSGIHQQRLSRFLSVNQRHYRRAFDAACWPFPDQQVPSLGLLVRVR